MYKNILLWLVLGSVIASLFGQFKIENNNNQISYSQFIESVNKGNVSSVKIAGSRITGETSLGQEFETYSPGDLGMMGDLLNNGVSVQATPPAKESFVKQLIISLAPILLLIGVILYTMRGAGGAMGGKNPMSFGKSKARLITKDESHVTFEDVAGVDEAREEVSELVDFLSDPSKFTRVGGKIPKGVLMIGPPGTGKTLLAKAVAGEADVPFFFISGSDFVEMFVGVGASRVRDMFEQAKKNAPCIIFIDEIDAVGRHRGAGLGGGHDEREQTLNQLLVEMDGFEVNDGVIVIAATNRPDVLDPALLRPGRFDRQVHVPLPDIRGREQILKVHMRKVPLDDDVDPGIIARGTPGFSGADLANLINEAALFAARASKRLVNMEDFELAKDKVLMGVERRSIVMPEEERLNTAYHESGHTVVAKVLKNTDPVHKVTIIPRGRALGVTMQLPVEDRYSHDRNFLLSRIAVLMGGRVAEEIFMGQMTTGAANDFEQATDMARNMVSRWGMSDELGTRIYGENESEVFLGRDVTTHRNLSNSMAELVDSEISRIINDQYTSAKEIIETHRDKVETMAHALMEWETLDADQIDAVMEGRDPAPPSSSSGGSQSGKGSDSKESKTSSGGDSEPRMDNPASHSA